MKLMISTSAVAAALLAAPAAYATTVDFDTFSAAQGTTSGNDGLGNDWTLTQSGSLWVFKYTGTYNSSFTFPSASDFEITFVPATTTTSGASVGVDSGVWNVAFADPTITFSGPAVGPGQGFLFAVDVNGVAGVPSPGFTASWSTTATPTPELSTWALMGLGFAALAFAGYRARRASAAPA